MTAHPAKPTVAEVQRLVDLYYEIDGNSVGGSLHIVLDDGNVATELVSFCANWAAEHGDVRGWVLAGLLLLMSKTQRHVLAESAHAAWTGDAGAEFDRVAAPLIERWLT